MDSQAERGGVSGIILEQSHPIQSLLFIILTHLEIIGIIRDELQQALVLFILLPEVSRLELVEGLVEMLG